MLLLVRRRRSVRRQSVVRPLVISRKLRKTDPQLLLNTIRKLAPLILLLRSYNRHLACQTTLLLRDSLSLSHSCLLWPQP